MSTENLKISHLNDYTPDSDDPEYDGIIAARLCAKALAAAMAKIDVLAAKINVLTAKLNADAGVTDTNYATDFATDFAATIDAVEYTGE